jgi:isocitrate/isopropylmalate dehydrogenase
MAASAVESKVIETKGPQGTAAPGRQHYRIASIPADGIGPEVISAGITVLQELVKELDTFDLDFEHFDWDSERYKREGKYMPDDALEIVRKFDAILFGAVGAPGTF